MTSNYLRASAYICTLDLCEGQGKPDGRQSCIVLESESYHSLVAKLPQHSLLSLSVRVLCCRQRTLRARPRIGVRKLLMPDVMAPEAHQNDRSSLPCNVSDSGRLVFLK